MTRQHPNTNARARVVHRHRHAQSAAAPITPQNAASAINNRSVLNSPNEAALSLINNKGGMAPDMEASSSHLFECTVVINHQTVNALFDTGCEHSAISLSLARRLHLPVDTHNKPSVLGADGSRLHIQGTSTIRFAFRNKAFEHHVLVCDKLLFDMIIGVDLLRTTLGILDFFSRTYHPMDDEPVHFKSSHKLLTAMTVEAPIHGHSINASKTETVHIQPFNFKVSSTAVDFEADLVIALPTTNSAVSPDQRAAIEAVIRRFRSSFASDTAKVSRTTAATLHIDTGDAAPVTTRFRQGSKPETEMASAEVRKMLDNGIIVPSTSNWCANLIFVRKKDKTFRPCVDFRGLNRVTTKIPIAMPRTDVILGALGRATIFSTIDFLSGFWQIPIEPESQEKTSFICDLGQFKFQVMPFGLVNAPAVFQQMMINVLHRFIGHFVHVYLDDIVIFSSSVEEHLQHLVAVFSAIRDANLQMRLSKCTFACDNITFLGHSISHNGIRPLHDKIASIRDFPVPCNANALRRFLGLAVYYQKFIKDFASTAACLHSLTSKKKTWTWTAEHTVAFDKLRKALQSQPVLTHPDYNQPFLLKTDASDRGLGAVLTQIDPETKAERVIAYASRILNDAERKYNVSERECLGIMWALEHWRTILFGHEIEITTDHHALTWLESNKQTHSKLFRWSLRISAFGNITIRYKSGKANADADALSRIFDAATDDTQRPFIQAALRTHSTTQTHDLATDATCNDELFENLNSAELAKLQLEDEFAGRCLRFLNDNNCPEHKSLPRSTRRQVESSCQFMSLSDGVLFYSQVPRDAKRRASSRLRLVIPQSLVDFALHACHESLLAGHLGMDRTYQRAVARYFWPKLYSDVMQHVSDCMMCQQVKPLPARNGNLVPIHAQQPWELVGMDVLGGIRPTANGNSKILVLMDYFTRFAIAIPLKADTANEIARAIVQHVVFQFGAPKTILTDRGPSFVAKTNDALFRMLGIERRLTTPYHPMTNGLTERFNRTVTNILSCFVNEARDDWDTWLSSATYAYNTSFHQAVQDTPFWLMYGRDAIDPADRILGTDKMMPSNPAHRRNDIVDAFPEVQRRVIDARKQASAQQEATYNRSAVRTHRTYTVGQLVWVYVHARKDAHSGKFDRDWIGPKRIVAVHKNNNTVVVSHLGKDNLTTVNTTSIRPYTTGVVSLDSEDAPAASPTPSNVNSRNYRPQSLEPRLVSSSGEALPTQQPQEGEEEEEEEDETRPTVDRAATQARDPSPDLSQKGLITPSLIVGEPQDAQSKVKAMQYELPEPKKQDAQSKVKAMQYELPEPKLQDMHAKVKATHSELPEPKQQDAHKKVKATHSELPEPKQQDAHKKVKATHSELPEPSTNSTPQGDNSQPAEGQPRSTPSSISSSEAAPRAPRCDQEIINDLRAIASNPPDRPSDRNHGRPVGSRAAKPSDTTQQQQQQQSPTSSPSPNWYIVENILRSRTNKGRVEYLCKWSGYPNSCNSWEPASSFETDDLIRRFESQTSLNATQQSSVRVPSRRKSKTSPRTTVQPACMDPADSTTERRTTSSTGRHVNVPLRYRLR